MISSGGVPSDSLQRRGGLNPFDEVKVVVKRSEVDSVHTVFAPAFVLTSFVKLCRVAHRRQILWSVGNIAESILWTCKEISPLCDIGTVHQVVRSGAQLVTNVHW